MKKILILMLLLGSGFLQLNACDICGFGVSNYNPFLFPHLSRTYIGFNYIHRFYHVHNDDGSLKKEYYNTFLFSGQYSLTGKIQIVALVPYQSNKLTSIGKIKNLTGFGDITLLANYRLWSKASKITNQTIMIGGGIKLPTGKNAPTASSEIQEQAFQLGTGSIDYIVNGSYQLNLNNWIFRTMASYKYNTKNKTGYHFGNQINSGLTTAYRKDFSKFSIAPYLQIIEEIQLKDVSNKILQHNSGGQLLHTGFGIDINTNKIAFGLNYQCAGGFQSNPQLLTRISFVF